MIGLVCPEKRLAAAAGLGPGRVVATTMVEASAAAVENVDTVKVSAAVEVLAAVKKVDAVKVSLRVKVVGVVGVEVEVVVSCFCFSSPRSAAAELRFLAGCRLARCFFGAWAGSGRARTGMVALAACAARYGVCTGGRPCSWVLG